MIIKLEKFCGLKVLGIKADGAGVNRFTAKMQSSVLDADTLSALTFQTLRTPNPLYPDISVRKIAEPTHCEKKVPSQIFSSWLTNEKRKMEWDGRAIVRVGLCGEAYYPTLNFEVVKRSSLAAMRVWTSRALLNRDLIAKVELMQGKHPHALGS